MAGRGVLHVLHNRLIQSMGAAMLGAALGYLYGVVAYEGDASRVQLMNGGFTVSLKAMVASVGAVCGVLGLRLITIFSLILQDFFGE